MEQPSNFISIKKITLKLLAFKLIRGGYYFNRHPVLGLQSLLFQQLQVLLTLYSEFFASFPYGTCTLSVSHRVFSLRWSIPPDSGCTLKQPDSRTSDPSNDSKHLPSPFVGRPLQGLSPSLVTPFQVI